MEDAQLENYRTDLAYLREMWAQTVKDFERFGYELVLSPDLPFSYPTCLGQLTAQLDVWCRKESDRLPSLLYLVDIPEHLLPGGNGCADTRRLAELILKRELIKIIYRKHYSA